ncbi:MAG: hydrogenase nickel incorporation protein HypB [Firmicutes bacterium]|nr:hydrogenase nickel incorporation protein HypB [Bacillota bacterium]
MEEIKIIELKQSVFEDNDKDAERLRAGLKDAGVFLMNLMSSPGSGKTTLLLSLAEKLVGRLEWAVMEADIDSDVDAARMIDAGVRSVQLHTGGMCHLDADMTRQGIAELGIVEDDMGNTVGCREKLDLVVLENVGNLVCPAEFDTGACLDVTILSVPEGDDKPLKYPLMYEKCGILIVSKIDVLPYFDFDTEKVVANARMRNPKIDVIFVSAKTGEGMDELAAKIEKRVREWQE